jgi:hypothetical protein
MSNSTRIFSFGLGRSPSRSLVKGLARATNGRFVFIPPDTSVDIYVGEQLEKALQSSITNIQVKWNLGRNVINVPTTIPPVYSNDRLIVYALAHDDDNNQSRVFDHNSTVELYNDKHRLGEGKVNRIPNISDNGTITRLAAKALILELQHSKLSSSNKKNGSRQARFEEQMGEEREKLLSDEKEERKKRIIDLSLKYNILSPYTAFVGIEKRMNGNNDDMVLREVPIQISADDQHLNNSLYIQTSFSSAQYSYSPVLLKCCEEMDLIDNCYESNSMDDDDDLYPGMGMTTNYSNTDGRLLLEEYAYSTNANLITEEKEETFPEDNQDIVRRLISKQAFDGLWDLNSKEIEQITGKPLSHFQPSTNIQVLVSAIVVLILETRFTSFSSMWHGIVQKARKRLLDLLGNDSKKLNTLFDDIREQL